MSSMGSAIYYIRKLYKQVLSENLTEAKQSPLKEVATFVYFIARPFFSIAFALLVVIGMKSGLILSGASQSTLGYGFVQMTMFFSFFVGFLTGRFLRRLESWGERVLERVSGEGQI